MKQNKLTELGSPKDREYFRPAAKAIKTIYGLFRKYNVDDQIYGGILDAVKAEFGEGVMVFIDEGWWTDDKYHYYQNRMEEEEINFIENPRKLINFVKEKISKMKKENKDFNFKVLINEELRKMNEYRDQADVSTILEAMDEAIEKMEEELFTIKLTEGDSKVIPLLKETLNVMGNYRRKISKL